MERSEKVDLFKTGLKRIEAYTVFMASGETDLSLLPEPITNTEKKLMALCKEKLEAKKFVPADSTNPDGKENGQAEKSNQPAPEEEKPAAKKTSARRTTKKT